MTLWEVLKELRIGRVIVSPPRLPAQLKCQQSLVRIEQRFDRVRSLAAHDVAALLTKLRRVATTGDWETVTGRDLRFAASCLFEQADRLADDQVFLTAYLGALRSRPTRSGTRRLIHTYCANYSDTHRGIRIIGEFLSEAVQRWDWNWRHRHLQFRIFDPQKAPAILARTTDDVEQPRQELAKAGLETQLAAGGLGVAAFRLALEEIRRRLTQNPRLEEVERAIAWTQSSDGRPYYLYEAKALIECLLLPWVQADPPTEHVKRRIQEFLLQHFSDPRTSGERWATVAPNARQVIMRWLAHGSLEMFMRVVDRVAQPQQWEFRRAFWKAYIDRNVVADSWVCFGSDGARLARQIVREMDGEKTLEFGVLKGASRDQAVLLLRIGDLVVADWNQNGSMRIWRVGENDAPHLYQPTYSASDLRLPCAFDTRHQGPWQIKAAGFIRQRTGIRLSEREYMPLKDR
jgi:hypothetical protein